MVGKLSGKLRTRLAYRRRFNHVTYIILLHTNSSLQYYYQEISDLIRKVELEIWDVDFYFSEYKRCENPLIVLESKWRLFGGRKINYFGPLIGGILKVSFNT